MAAKVNANSHGLSSLLKDGYKVRSHTGRETECFTMFHVLHRAYNDRVLIQHMQGLEEAVYRNISACREMTEITRSSFGPNGKRESVH